jgi:outer membrane protein OmpA-like peptidoglycan-associated protein
LSPATAIESLNTRFHEGPASVNADGKTMYFSRDSHADKDYKLNKKANAKFSQVYLYKATKTDNGTWGNITQLPINSKDYSVSNPSISKDGKTLYFNSDMPGGQGGLDIWKITVNNTDNTYGTPENLGKEVNTPGTEQFPFISDEDVLYFSSSGRQGLGGLDVFMIDLNEKNEKNKTSQNVGKPVNSEKDDFAFTYNSTKNKGFFSSSRSGADDIFMATAICGVMATSTVTDAKTGAILAGASVSILDDKKNTIATKIADESGQVQYPIECDKAYIIQATKEGYESGTFNIAAGKTAKVAIAATLNPIEVIIKPEEVVLKPINFEYDKSNITKEGAFELDQLVMIMKNKPEMIILAKSHTDNRGSDDYNNRLSERRAKSTVQYIISKGIDESRISGKGYGKSEPKVDCQTNCTETDHATNRRSEFLIVK